jgi:hypothetical protein
MAITLTRKKRNNPIIGLVMLKDFEFDGNDEWQVATYTTPKAVKL